MSLTRRGIARLSLVLVAACVWNCSGGSSGSSSEGPSLSGFWIASDAGAAADGLVVYSVDGGWGWSPWGLTLRSGGVHFCNNCCDDFIVVGGSVAESRAALGDPQRFARRPAEAIIDGEGRGGGRRDLP